MCVVDTRKGQVVLAFWAKWTTVDSAYWQSRLRQTSRGERSNELYYYNSPLIIIFTVQNDISVHAYSNTVVVNFCNFKLLLNLPQVFKKHAGQVINSNAVLKSCAVGWGINILSASKLKKFDKQLFDIFRSAYPLHMFQNITHL